MTDKKTKGRRLRLQQKTKTQMVVESENQGNRIQDRSDYTPKLQPFLDRLTLGMDPAVFKAKKSDQARVLTLCNQAPLELFHAAGLGLYKLACGSFAARDLAPQHLPVLTCPMIKSLAGVLNADDRFHSGRLRMVIPTTCDWVVKFSELTGLYDTADIHFMELPHLREDERASRRWLEEVHQLKQWLENTTGKRISKKALHQSIQLYAKAYALFDQLIELKRRHQVPAIHFAIIANAMPFEDIEQWTAHLTDYMSALSAPGKPHNPVFLTGSPLWFPNYKLLNLIEDAAMSVVADDICSLERAFPGPVAYEDRSEFALLNALAQRSHKACICPTFADNHRRLNAILNILKKWNIKGVIFHVLKGCHPYDGEAGILEVRLKERGYRFLKIETDYVNEDEQNILTRLEAFRRTLERQKIVGINR